MILSELIKSESKAIKDVYGQLNGSRSKHYKNIVDSELLCEMADFTVQIWSELFMFIVLETYGEKAGDEETEVKKEIRQ